MNTLSDVQWFEYECDREGRGGLNDACMLNSIEGYNKKRNICCIIDSKVLD